MKLSFPFFIVLANFCLLGTVTADFDSGSWSTSFDYSQTCTQRGYFGDIDCEVVSTDSMINWSWGSGTDDGKSTQATADANNVRGDGGLGARFWVGDGVNNQLGEISISFPQQEPELWIRWYQRYEAGFKWQEGEPYYDKTLYIYSTGFGEGQGWINPQYHGNAGAGGTWTLSILGGSDPYQAVSSLDLKWTDVFGSVSDGQFHLFEIHIKMDTDGTDGVGKMWIDGKRVINNTGVNWSEGHNATRDGWSFIEFESNQHSPDNGRYMYVDYDDIEIWNTTPPNRDEYGDPWIGPLNGFLGAGGHNRPNPPTDLQVR